MSAHAQPRASSRRKRGARTPAQAMVEFGLALPVLLLVMYGLIESGRLLFMYASVVSAARQAVRYGSVTGENGAGTPNFNDCDGIRAAAKRLGFLQPIQDSDIQISYDTGPGSPVISSTCPLTAPEHPVKGDRIRVEVSTDFTPIVPLVPFEPFTIASAGYRTLLVGVSIAVDVPGAGPPPAGGAMSLFKNSNPSSFTGPNQTITYTYTITNLGSTPLENISMTDNEVARQGHTVNCAGAVDPLPGGASTTCTATYLTEDDDVEREWLENTGTVTATSDGTPLYAQSTLRINFIPQPAITLTKDGDAPGIIEPGALINYTFTLQNTGNVKLNGPYTILDALVGSNWDCPDDNVELAVGASLDCTGHYALKNNDITSRSVTNYARATALYKGYTVTSNQASASVPVPPMLLEWYPVTGPTPGTVPGLGSTITWRYKLTNRQWRTRYNVVITDTAGTFTCIGTLYGNAWTYCPSGSRSYSGYTQAAVDAGKVVIQAIAEGQGSIRSNQVTFNVAVTQSKQLTLNKTLVSVPNPIVAGGVITYGYQLTNPASLGSVTLSAPFVVTDTKIPSIDCSGVGATMPPGTTRSCANATYTITADDINLYGSIINKATATAKFNTETISSTQQSQMVITYPGARLGLKKTADPAYFSSSGQALNYKFTLMNTGGVVLTTPFDVNDPFIAETCPASGTIPIGGSIDCTGTYLISPTDFAAGFFTNVASASAKYLTSTISSPPATFTASRFICSPTKVRHGDPTPIPNGSSASWTIINETTLELSITSITVSWGSAPPLLTQVRLGSLTPYSGQTSASGGFVVPGGPWPLPVGNSIMQLQFNGNATNIRIVVSVSGPSCNINVDSNTASG